MTYRSLRHKLLPLAAGTVFAAGALLSCNDESFFDRSLDSRYIVFKVSDADMPNPKTRGVDTDRYVGTNALTAGQDTLYLSATSTCGIDPAANSKKTRAEEASGELASFGVYASLSSGGEYMQNVKIAKEGDYWAPEEEYLWPGHGSLLFHTYAPYTETPGSEGITSLPEKDETGDYSLSFAVPSNIENQIDLMYGDPISASSSPCALNMHHALTAIRFVTGKEMAPSIIKSISISGVKFKGSLNLESGVWTCEDDTTTYNMVCNKELPRGTNEFVTPGMPLTPDNVSTLLLMPQEFGEEAQIKLEMNWGGNDYTFTTSLSGKQWVAGTTLTYRLSANPGIPVLRLEVVDAETGKVLTEITPGWKGGKKNYKVVSNYDPATGEDVIPIPWEAVLIAPDGHEITAEERKSESNKYHNIEYYDAFGTGTDTVCQLITILPEPTFVGTQSDATMLLRNALDINESTDCKPYYNLAQLAIHDNGVKPAKNSVYNTSNCYTVNNPGKYCLPLVYGNAIVDGKYQYETHSGDRQEIANGGLRNFINHRGDDITSAYIYDHTGCMPMGAKLLWTDQINVIRDVKLETVDDQPMLTFNVPKTSIRQCNAVVAVTDKDGVVMWSWHIWVTSMKTNSLSEYIPIDHTDGTGLHQHYLYHTNIGHIYAGDNVHFVSHPLTIKYRQLLPDHLAEQRMNPKEWEVKLLKADEDVSPVDYFLLYQWGRKDPFVPSIKKYYDENHNAIPVGEDTDEIRLTDSDKNVKRLIEEGIKRPMANWVSLKNNQNFPPGFSLYHNLWNIEGAKDEHGEEYHKPYKSIYDPSPVGCKLPIGAVLELLVGMPYRWAPHYGSSDVPAGVFNINGKDLFIFAAGYRDPAGIYNNSGEGLNSIRQWYIWEGSCIEKQGKAIHGDDNGAKKSDDVFTSSLGVRPMHVEGDYF